MKGYSDGGETAQLTVVGEMNQIWIVTGVVLELSRRRRRQPWLQSQPERLQLQRELYRSRG